MKNTYALLITLIFFFGAYAQELDCDTNVHKAVQLLEEKNPFNDEKFIFNLLEPCAQSGHTAAENLYGVLYLKGIGTAVDENRAFSFIERSAHKGLAKAQFNLGRMYKDGVGCDIDFDKAITWFEKATVNGNQRAAYSLGYMYFKGLGVGQDYTKAIHWFKQSTDPMAKHFLGLCYYQGYGTAIDEEEAVGILMNNDIPNSTTLLQYIQANQREATAAVVEEALSKTTNEDVVIDNLKEKATESLSDLPNLESIAPNDIEGTWTGRLIQYDWSGQKIERIVPIDLAFSSSEENTMEVTAAFLEQEKKATATFEEDYIYFHEPFVFTFDKLYSSNKHELTLDYDLLSIAVQKQRISGQSYLIGSVDTYITNWKEYGQPSRLILMPADTEYNEAHQEMLLALAQQEHEFIKLYPVPFTDQLTVQYELEVAAEVYIELNSLTGGDPIVILPPTQQQAGDHLQSARVSPGLKAGLYVVRLWAGDQYYTRLIIKENR